MEGKTCAEVDSCSTAAEVIAECSAHPQQNHSRSNRLRSAGTEHKGHNIRLISTPALVQFRASHPVPVWKLIIQAKFHIQNGWAPQPSPFS